MNILGLTLSYHSSSWVIDLDYDFVLSFDLKLWNSNRLWCSALISLAIISDSIVWWY